MNRVGFGGPELIHLYIQTKDVSLCQKRARDKIERQVARPDHVPMVVHYSDICPDCLYQLEVGPVDEGNNRVLPVSRFIHPLRER